jgi:ABC-type multidrug transport system permease subunit
MSDMRDLSDGGSAALPLPVGGSPGRQFVGPLPHFWASLVVTARLFVARNDAYKIEVVRGPLSLLVVFGVWRLTYAAAGRLEVAGADASGFLFVGMFGMTTWGATVWSIGNALVRERGEGTLAALFISPVSRVALIAGYGAGQFVITLRVLSTLLLLALATGARLNVRDPAALVAGAVALPLAAFATGFAFSGLFILSRRGNLLANFLQTPIWLAAGFVVPRTELHPWLRRLSDVLPASHAVDALRAGSLRAATLADLAPDLTWFAGTSLAWVLVGLFALRGVEHAAKRAGTLGLG